MLFSWYFKGFELFRRYLVKHPTRVDMESLDLEEVDKEMAIDEATQSSASSGVLENTPADDALLVTPLLVTILLLMPEPMTYENFLFF